MDEQRGFEDQNHTEDRQSSQPPQSDGRRPRRRRRRRRGIPKTLYVISGIVLALVVVETVLSVRRMVTGSAPAQTSEAEQPAETPKKELAKVSFCAVGDNLINTEGEYTVDLLEMAREWGSSSSSKKSTDDEDAYEDEYADASYDFSPLYANIKDTVSSYDIAFINQETTLGGTENGFDYAGYPAFNTPDELAEAIADAGFDVVNTNTNHTYDTGSASIEHSQEVWDKQKGVTTIGSYKSEKDREDIRVIEKNGIKIAFLSYCYGQNGYEQEDLPNDYYAVPFDKAKMKEEVKAAKEVADAVVVYMHWGDDYKSAVSAEQSEYASYLAGLGVDLVIGSHAQVIQPVKYISRGMKSTTDAKEGSSSSTSEDDMLCVYGLGNFVSGYKLPNAVLSGMFTCDFVRDEDGNVTVQNPEWLGLVEHNDGTNDSVYLLSDYSEKLAKENLLLEETATGADDEDATDGEDGTGTDDADAETTTDEDGTTSKKKTSKTTTDEDDADAETTTGEDEDEDGTTSTKKTSTSKSTTKKDSAISDDPTAWAQDKTREVLGDTISVEV